MLRTSSEIDAELRTKPKKEHEYDPVKNILTCNNVSEYEFPLVIEVVPKRSVADGGRYSTLKLEDGNSGHSFVEFDILDVRS